MPPDLELSRHMSAQIEQAEAKAADYQRRGNIAQAFIFWGWAANIRTARDEYLAA